jgi:hypothetical protein
MKSLLTDVFWPAWEWGPYMPYLRYICFSYSDEITTRDNLLTDVFWPAWEWGPYMPYLRYTRPTPPHSRAAPVWRRAPGNKARSTGAVDARSSEHSGCHRRKACRLSVPWRLLGRHHHPTWTPHAAVLGGLAEFKRDLIRAGHGPSPTGSSSAGSRPLPLTSSARPSGASGRAKKRLVRLRGPTTSVGGRFRAYLGSYRKPRLRGWPYGASRSPYKAPWCVL